MKKAVIFDLYNTLIGITTDEYDPWVYGVLSNYLSYHGVNARPEELKDAYFRGIRKQLDESPEPYPEADVFKVFLEIMRGFGPKRHTRQAVLDAVMLFRSLTIRRFGLFEGVNETLPLVLRRYKTAIISDAQWSFTGAEIAKLGLTRFFRLRLLSSNFGYKKPDTRLFGLALRKLNVKPEDALYIGDNPPKDLICAKSAGLKFVFFGGKCRSYDGLTPDACFSRYADLMGVLEECFQKRPGVPSLNP